MSPFRSFAPSTMPRLTRVHYRRELLAWLLLPVMLGAVEGGVVGVLAKNAFEGVVSERWLEAVVAILAGAPAFANITSFAWAGLSLGRDKIRFLMGLQIAAAVLVASIAFAPRSGAGLALVTVAAIGARMCWSGVVTLRATVWQANYPRSTRARMAGKLATIQALTLSAVGVVIALAMSRDESAFRTLYPATAAAGLGGALVYGRMRVRGHRALRRREREGDRSVQQLLSPAAMARVLKRDPLFARYMALMFVFGLGNLMISPVLVNVLRDEFGFGYRGGILIAATIPVGLMPLSIPIWARLLDRMHILRFRAIHCWSFLAATAVFTLAGMTHWPACLWIGSALRGLAIGGGVLGWNLGHQDFTDPSGGGRYMGVHVTLTGVRGLLAPALAILLYDQFGSGKWVFTVCLTLNTIGAIGFVLLARHRSIPSGVPDERPT